MTPKKNGDGSNPNREDLFSQLSELMKHLEENLEFEIYVAEQTPKVIQIMKTPHGNLLFHQN